jgi:hypothetical protein
MNSLRTQLAPFACLLLLLVLYNGLACSIGHGQMMRSMFMPEAATALGHQHHHASGAMEGMAGMHHGPSMSGQSSANDMAIDHSMPMPGMNSPFGDCFFAGSLPLGVIAFALISWLLRYREARPNARLALFGALPRTLLPNLNPRAP